MNQPPSDKLHDHNDGLESTRHPGHRGPGPVHYGLSLAQMRRKTGSNADFAGPRPLCGNGAFHCTTTIHPDRVTCDICKHKLAQKPGYL